MSCNHNAFTFQYGIAFDRVSTRFCPMCSDFVPWGPANDTPEVLVEIRAMELAEFAVGNSIGYSPDVPLEEYEGWNLRMLGGATPADVDGAAGWLARDIYISSLPRRLTDAAIDKAFADAPATIREVQESLRGVVTP